MRTFSAYEPSPPESVFFMDGCHSFSGRKRITVRAARKPNSVPGSGYPCRATIIHLWVPVARHLLRPTRELGRATLKRSPIWSCTGWGLPSFPGHPRNWCALTAPFHPYPAPNHPVWYRAVYFLLHFPSRYRDSTLWSTLPCGVRTFLRIYQKSSDRLAYSDRLLSSFQ